MTFRTIILAMVMAVAVATQALAADLAALRRQTDASQAAVTSPSAPCNKEAESFSEFIVKFTVDEAFNASRSKISSMFALKPVADYRALVVTTGHDAGYYQQWQEIGADSVVLACAYAGAPADYHYVFRRQGGKWYLVDRITPDF
ncbi:MAG: hypothetical protein HDS92_06985 [Bacteroidales bacterium]|nr:hypothetical protein [Bacteroidales bacterium]MBD5377939.1 hypothetical protein [Bacteroides sp.]